MKKKSHNNRILWASKNCDYRLFTCFEALGLTIDLAFSTEEAVLKLAQHRYKWLFLDQESSQINHWIILRFIEHFASKKPHILLPHMQAIIPFATQSHSRIQQSSIPKGMTPIKLAWFLKHIDKSNRCLDSHKLNSKNRSVGTALALCH